jgi:hypothetical protein
MDIPSAPAFNISWADTTSLILLLPMIKTEVFSLIERIIFKSAELDQGSIAST